MNRDELKKLIGGTIVTLPTAFDDDYQLGQYGILHRVGQDWATGIQIVTVTYSHGYGTLPDDIVFVPAAD